MLELSQGASIQLAGIVIVVGLIVYAIRGAGEKKPSQEKQPRFKTNTPTLDSYATDFTALASIEKLNPVIGREKEILRLAQILTRKGKNNAILVGPPGVGKTAIAEGLAQRIVDGSVPEELKGKRVLSLAVASLMAGTKYRGEFEQRAKKIVQEISAANRTVILFIDEVHVVIQSRGAEGSVNFTDILKPALARGDLQMIGATTTKEYEKYIKSDSSLERRFQPVQVKEPTIKETLEILTGVKNSFREYHKVEFTDASLEVAAKLSRDLIKERRLPDKAIDAMDEAAAMVKVAHIHEHIPSVLYAAAVKKHPSLAKTWKAMQVLDEKFAVASKKEKKALQKQLDALEKKLLEKGVLVVDADDVELVIKQWYTNVA